MKTTLVLLTSILMCGSGCALMAGLKDYKDDNGGKGGGGSSDNSDDGGGSAGGSGGAGSMLATRDAASPDADPPTDAAPCGFLGAACCANNQCGDPGMLTCDEQFRCSPCGHVGQLCCAGACYTGSCTSEYSSWCEDTTAPCGAVGEKCCASGICNSGLSCHPKTDGGAYDECR